MGFPKITRFLWCYFTILLAFGQALVLTLPEVEPAIPEDGLQIRLERELFEKQGSIIYASHLEFDEEPKISPRQLLKIAIDAFKEMKQMVAENKLKKKKPSVMTTLIVGKEIIFASSSKGVKYPVKEDGQVQDDLAECGQGSENKHRNNGRCGEVMAFHEYYESRVDAKKLGKDSGARLVSISFPRDVDVTTAQPEIIVPCGSGDDWGCNRLVKHLDVLDNDKVAADPEMAEFDYKKLRKEGKLKSVKTRFEEGNGPDPVDQPGKNNQKGPPPSNLPPRPTKKRPSTSADTGDDGDSEDKNVDGGKRKGPPPSELPPRPPKKGVETRPDAGDSGAKEEVNTRGGKQGPPRNTLPPRPPRQRPSAPVEPGSARADGGDGDKETNGGRKRPRPPPRVHHRSRAPDKDDGEKSGHDEPGAQFAGA